MLPLMDKNASVREPFALVAPPSSRHDHMVKRFSSSWATIAALRVVGVDRSTAAEVIDFVCDDLGVAPPTPSFHGGRGPHTGYCMPPRDQAVARTNEGQVLEWERGRGSVWPEYGLVRLGDPTALATVAHELGHHLAYLTEPVGTPAHGKRWVGHFDRAAVTIDRLLMDR